MSAKLGKITDVTFGRFRESSVLGIKLGLEFGSCATEKTYVCWDHNKVKNKSQEAYGWSEADRDKQAASVMREISDLLFKAKVDDIKKLKGIPIEVTLDGKLNMISWRILEEVL